MSDVQVGLESPYDEAEFLSRLEGDRELGDEIIQIFLEQCPQAIVDIRQALEDGDMDLLSRHAHGLKGSVGVFAAEAAFAAALDLEIAGRDGDEAGAREACLRLDGEMVRLTAALDENAGGSAPCDY